MRSKKVWRYYCEFCKKSGCSKYHIEKHENHCTANPNRGCGFCEKIGDGGPVPMEELIALLPDPKKYLVTDYAEVFGGGGSPVELRMYPGLKEAAEKGLEKVRDATDNCPGCILAAVRQSGTAKTCVLYEVFQYRKEAEAWLSCWNDDHQEEY